MKKIDVNILLFGITKDLVGKQKFHLQLPEAITIADFKKLLNKKYPELVELDSLAIAVNSEYATDEIVLKPNDEIALIPPVSGG
jgi:molybdopterin converting factor subunit 1